MAGIINLTVGGINYPIKGDVEQKYLNELGNELENKLRIITKQNPDLSTTMVAMLAALDYCDRAKRAEAEVLRLKEELHIARNLPKQMRIDE